MIRAWCVLATLTLCGALAAETVFENPVALEGEEFETAIDYNGVGLAYLDWDGDGRPDILASNRIGHLAWYKNIGTKEAPAFGRGQIVKEGWTVIYAGFYGTCNVRFAVADLNGDGVRDLVVGLNKLPYYKKGDEHFTSRLGIALGNKAGGFDKLVPLKAKDGSDLIGDRNMPAPALADLNGDGKQDLVVGSEKGGLTVFLNEGTDAAPAYDAKGVEIAGIEGQRTVPVVCDWNGDGKLDLVVGTLDGIVRVYLREGDGKALTFGKGAPVQVAGKDFGLPPPIFGEDLKTSPAVPCVCDFNGDGKKDLLVGTQKQFTLLANSGTDAAPVFATAQLVKGKGIASSEGSPTNLPPIVCDVDADGRNDLLMAVDTESVCNAFVWFKNVGEKGKPRFTTGKLLTRMPVNTRCGRFDLGDLNGDGLFDLVVSTKGGGTKLFVAWNTGTKGSPKFPLYAPDVKPDPNVAPLMNAAGRQINTGPAGGYARSLADLNGDGLVDILEGGNSITDPNAKWNYKFLFLYRNVGDAKKPVFEAAADNLKIAGTDVQILAPELCLPDMDGDGRCDVVVTGAAARTTRVLLNRTPKGAKDLAFEDGGTLMGTDGKPATIFSVAGKDYFGTFNAPLGVGDLDGDGIPDAVGRTEKNGFEIWFLRGVKK